jgi:cytochrome c-type biogenesis protein CcmH
MQYNTRALQVDPRSAGARTHRALLASAIGQTDRALGLLDEVLADDASFEPALVYKGWIASEAGRWDLAVDALEKAVAIRPDPSLQGRLEEARRNLAGGSPPTAAPAPAATSRLVRVVVDISPEAKARAQGASLLFVSLRQAGVAAGPPLAAKRVPVSAFPTTVEVLDTDRPMMSGAPLPDRFDLVARLDTDGDPMTRPDSDPHATVEGVATGADVPVLLQ